MKSTEPTAEEYLLAIYRIASRMSGLDRNDPEVSYEGLSEELKFDNVRNCKALDELDAGELVRSYVNGVALTPAGWKTAARIIVERQPGWWKVLKYLAVHPLFSGAAGGVLAAVITVLLTVSGPPWWWPDEPDSAPPSAEQASPAVPARTITARTITARTFPVIRVIDGDTLEILYDGVPTSCRLPFIDAPERGDPGFDEATEALRKLVGDGPATIRFSDPDGRKRDRYGHLLVSVEVGGVDVEQVLLERGLVEPWEE